MKNKKIIIGILLIIVVLLLIAVVLFFPKAKTGSEIAALLKPVITAENQSMDISLDFMIAGKETSIHSTMYWLTEGENTYIVIEQGGHPVYIVDDVLYLENGAAFLIYDKGQEVKKKSLDVEMFSQIAALYEMFEITVTKEDEIETYTVEVSGEEAQKLIAQALPDVYEELSQIDSLKVNLTAKEDELTSVSYSGGATVNGKEMALQMQVDNFKVLVPGEYVIPGTIQDAIKTVDKDELFCITEDLYRLMVGFSDLANQEQVAGSVKLSANCGMINFKKTYDLAELETNTVDLENAEQIENLPDMIAYLCLEGDISCVEEADGYHYI